MDHRFDISGKSFGIVAAIYPLAFMPLGVDDVEAKRMLDVAIRSGLHDDVVGLPERRQGRGTAEQNVEAPNRRCGRPAGASVFTLIIARTTHLCNVSALNIPGFAPV